VPYFASISGSSGRVTGSPRLGGNALRAAAAFFWRAASKDSVTNPLILAERLALPCSSGLRDRVAGCGTMWK